MSSKDWNILVTLLEEARPVGYRSGHHAGVDKVKLGGECPCFFEVVDVEADIRGDAVMGARGD